ncbi:unnamed protein product, partial [marine sediment metagenome]
YSFKNNGEWGAWLRLREGLNLTAVSGEERRYQIRVAAVRRGQILEQRELDFLIDKRKPRPPQLIMADSGCLQGSEINFSASQGELVYYAVNSLVTEHGKLWERKPIPLELKGEEAGKIFVQAYSQDAAGNKSFIKTFNLTLDPCFPFLEILSPAPGNYANTQILYINSRNMARIYSSKFIPDVIYVFLRGGAYMGNVISEYFKLAGRKSHPVYYAAVVARSYTGISTQKDVKVEGWTYNPEYLRQGDKVLIVDDIFDTGKTMNHLAKIVMEKGIPRSDIKVVVHDYKIRKYVTEQHP